ncbi:MAG: cell division protein FtsQ/DivIB [Pseudomonadota bacterium]|nr:cell division protein FtsQ/DivIB [Pseudomonadota bacterium]
MNGLLDSAAMRVAVWTLALALVALPVVAVVQGWIGAERWPLRTLRINGDLHRVDAAELRRRVLPHAQRGFFAVRLDDAQAAVVDLAWVEHAEVRKRWPDVLEVTVVEHRPFARWGDDRVLSEEGRLFPAKGIDVPASLPRLDGPAGQEAQVMALYGQSRELFAPAGIDVRALSLDRRGSWLLQLDDGVQVVIGSREARLRMARFARLLPQLLAQRSGEALLRADLRYTNGFALTWGDPEQS